MAKQKTRYVCQSCGADFPRWSGRCDACGQWNTLVEEVVRQEVKGRGARADVAGAPCDPPIGPSACWIGPRCALPAG